MREIKFRAWIGKYMMPWGFIDGAFRGPPSGNEGDGFNPLTCPHMQYTGLKDKNGVEIYEGDLLLGCNGIHMNREKPQCVEYDSGGVYPFAIPGWEGSASPETCEVIGNIYENPGLIS